MQNLFVCYQRRMASVSSVKQERTFYIMEGHGMSLCLPSQNMMSRRASCAYGYQATERRTLPRRVISSATIAQNLASLLRLSLMKTSPLIPSSSCLRQNRLPRPSRRSKISLLRTQSKKLFYYHRILCYVHITMNTSFACPGCAMPGLLVSALITFLSIQEMIRYHLRLLTQIAAGSILR